MEEAQFKFKQAQIRKLETKLAQLKLTALGCYMEEMSLILTRDNDRLLKTIYAR